MLAFLNSLFPVAVAYLQLNTILPQMVFHHFLRCDCLKRQLKLFMFNTTLEQYKSHSQAVNSFIYEEYLLSKLSFFESFLCFLRKFTTKTTTTITIMIRTPTYTPLIAYKTLLIRKVDSVDDPLNNQLLDIII